MEWLVETNHIFGWNNITLDGPDGYAISTIAMIWEKNASMDRSTITIIWEAFAQDETSDL